MPTTKIDLAEYTLSRDEKTSCGVCNAKVFLLSPRLSDNLGNLQMFIDRSKPWYYLCAKCGAVAQLGVGLLAGAEARR